MDGDRFDRFVRDLAGGTTRRSLLRGVASAVASTLVVGQGASAAESRRGPGEVCRKNGDCISGSTCETSTTGRQRCTCGAGLKPCGRRCIPEVQCCRAADCPDDGNPCTGTVCSSGVCSNTPRTGGTCSNPAACISNGTCQSGLCTGTACPSGDQCCGGTCKSQDGSGCTSDGDCCGGTCAGEVCCASANACRGIDFCCGAGETCASTSLELGGVQQELCCASGKACTDDDPKAVCCANSTDTCYQFGCCESGEFCLAEPGNPVCCPAGETCASTSLELGGIQQELCCASGKACTDDDPKAVCCANSTDTCYRFGCCESGVVCNGDPGNPVCCAAGKVCSNDNLTCVTP